MTNLIIEGLDKFNRISTLIKLYPYSGIQKSTFYELKHEFVEYILSNETKLNISSKAICKYKTTNTDIYNIQFNIDNIIKDINIADTYGYLKTRFEVHNIKDKIYYPVNYAVPIIPKNIDDSYKMCDHNVYAEYCDLIHWICNNKFFFLYNSQHIYSILHDNISKDSNYIVYTDPEKPITKLSYRHYDIICGYFDNKSNKILWHYNDISNIKELFTDEYITNNYTDEYPIKDNFKYISSVKKYNIYFGQCNNIKYPIDKQLYSDNTYIKQHADAIIKLHNHNEKYNQTSTRYFKELIK